MAGSWNQAFREGPGKPKQVVRGNWEHLVQEPVCHIFNHHLRESFSPEGFGHCGAFLADTPVTWKSGTAPAEWQVVLFFKKVDQRVRSNMYITLLSFSGKVYSMVQKRTPEWFSLFSYRTVDQLFNFLCLLGAWEFAIPNYVCFVDLAKVYDGSPLGLELIKALMFFSRLGQLGSLWPKDRVERNLIISLNHGVDLFAKF